MIVDPLSLVSNVVQIITACTATARTIDHLVKQYLNAPAKLQSLRAETELVGATLQQLQAWFKTNSRLAQQLESKPELKQAIDNTLTGCWAVFALLDKDLQRLVPPRGEKPNWKQRADLLFNDEIIRDYRSQIEGHIHGLNFVLICLQAQSVSQIEETLRKANEIFSNIAQVTLSIRNQHKEIDIPESIYDGVTIDEDDEVDIDEEFIKMVMNSKPYRRASKLKKSGSWKNAEPGPSSESSVVMRNNSITILPDQIAQKASPAVEEPGKDAEDLIDFSDNQLPSPMPSPQQRESISLRDIHSLQFGTDVHQNTGRESSIEERRDSTQAHARRVSDILSIIDRYQPNPDSPTSQEKSPIIDARLSGTLSPMSPRNSVSSLPQGSEHAPPTDDYVEEQLLQEMKRLNVQNYAQQLDWAEDVFRHCYICNKNKDIVSTSEKHREENDNALLKVAAPLVEQMARIGDGHACFIKARYIERSGATKRDNFLLAGSQGYHRAQYYLGQIYELENTSSSRSEAIRRYDSGAREKDAACLYRLSRAYFEGGLGYKKNEKEAVRLLREAAENADKDFPDPIHHLATMQITPPSFKDKLSKPLVTYNIATAISNFRRAAMLGHGPSQLQLGLAHRTGFFPTNKPSAKGRRDADAQTHVTVNFSLSLHYLELAARRGLPQADYEISNSLIWGSDELQRKYASVALAHAQRAAEGNWGEAFGLMGWIFEAGIGVEKDIKLSYQWYYQGAKIQEPFATSRFEKLRRRGLSIKG